MLGLSQPTLVGAADIDVPPSRQSGRESTRFLLPACAHVALFLIPATALRRGTGRTRMDKQAGVLP
jgi:hypothetical protein